MKLSDVTWITLTSLSIINATSEARVRRIKLPNKDHNVQNQQPEREYEEEYLDYNYENGEEGDYDDRNGKRHEIGLDCSCVRYLHRVALKVVQLLHLIIPLDNIT